MLVVLFWMSNNRCFLFLQKIFSVVMVDEAHERTLSTDILFGLVKVSKDFLLTQFLIRKIQRLLSVHLLYELLVAFLHSGVHA